MNRKQAQAELRQSKKLWHNNGMPIKRAVPKNPLGLSGRQLKKFNKAERAAKKAEQEEAQYSTYAEQAGEVTNG